MPTVDGMPAAGPMPGSCRLCGHLDGRRTPDGWRCAVCNWRYGDAPDPDLPRPRVDVVYYLRFDARVKIGTSSQPRRRLAALWHDELLAFERGDQTLERRRHAEFAALREGGEWFTAAPELLTHAAELRGDVDPWRRYARWVSEAYSPSAR